MQPWGGIHEVAGRPSQERVQIGRGCPHLTVSVCPRMVLMHFPSLHILMVVSLDPETISPDGRYTTHCTAPSCPSKV